jgi:NAD(P)-dependent dehydrogenase (short-subunit alcohol dehydrogenase family)
MQNKTAIITGSSRGIGKETAIQLAEHVANVVVCSRTQSAGTFRGLNINASSVFDTHLDGTSYSFQFTYEKQKHAESPVTEITIDLWNDCCITNFTIFSSGVGFCCYRI